MGRDCCRQLSEERERAVSERDIPITTLVYQHFGKDKWIGLPALLDFYSCGIQHSTPPIVNIHCLTMLNMKTALWPWYGLHKKKQLGD